MKSRVGALLAVLMVSACAAARPQTQASPSSGATDPRTELAGLEAKLAAERDELGLPEPEMPSQVSPMSTPVPVAPPNTCARSASETCTNVCALADAICNDANRICVLATELPGDGAATASCERGHATCDGATARCCGCV